MKQRTTILLIATIIIILGMSYFYTQNDIVVPAQLPVKDDSAFVFIHSEATKEQAFNALLQAEKDIVELQQRGFSTFFVRDRLRKAQQFYIGHLPQQLLSDISRAEGVNKEYLQKLYEVSETTPVFEVELQDFSKVVEITQFIAFKKQQIYDLADSISLIESDILALKAQDAPVTQAESTLNAAKEEFSSERYSDALFLLKETLTEMKEAQSERNRALYIIDLGKSFIERHWLAIIISIIILSIIIKPLYDFVQKIRAKKKVEELKAGLETLQGLIIKSQEDCFKNKKITTGTYKILVDRYKKQIAEIKQQIPVYQSIAEGKPLRTTSEDTEEKETAEELKKTQLRVK